MSNGKNPKDDFYNSLAKYSDGTEKTASPIGKEEIKNSLQIKPDSELRKFAEELGILVKEAQEIAPNLEESIVAPATPLTREEMETEAARQTETPFEQMNKGMVAPSLDAVAEEPEIPAPAKAQADVAKSQAEAAALGPQKNDEAVKESLTMTNDAKAQGAPGQAEAAVAAATDGPVDNDSAEALQGPDAEYEDETVEPDVSEDEEETVTAYEVVMELLKEAKEAEEASEFSATETLRALYKKAAAEEMGDEVSEDAEKTKKEDEDAEEDEDEEDKEDSEESEAESQATKNAADESLSVEKIASQILASLTEPDMESEMMKQAYEASASMTDQMMAETGLDLQTYASLWLKQAGMEDEEVIEKTAEKIAVESERLASINGDSAYITARNVVITMAEQNN
jgi:hypothetical protein